MNKAVTWHLLGYAVPFIKLRIMWKIVGSTVLLSQILDTIGAALTVWRCFLTTKWTMKSNHGSTNQGHNGIEHFKFKLLYANRKNSCSYTSMFWNQPIYWEKAWFTQVERLPSIWESALLALSNPNFPKKTVFWFQHSNHSWTKEYIVKFGNKKKRVGNQNEHEWWILTTLWRFRMKRW